VYTIEWTDKEGEHSVTVYPQEKADHLAYIREGMRAGWIFNYDIEYKEETW